MATKKDLVIAVLATFCLTATLFLIIPIKSSTGTDRYDPWLDVNDDGTSNILDLAASAKAFGSSGETTKNVNVTNWPTTPLHNYIGAEEYTVIDESRVVNGTEHGIYTISHGGAFAFSPKQNFISVANFSYMIQAYKEGVGLRFYDFTIDVNGVTVDQNHLEIQDYYPSARVGIASLAANYIHPGINWVHFQFQEYMFVLKISVYIEYQYQA